MITLRARSNIIRSAIALALVFSMTYFATRGDPARADHFDTIALAHRCEGGWTDSGFATSVSAPGTTSVQAATLGSSTDASLVCDKFRASSVSGLALKNARVVVDWKTDSLESKTVTNEEAEATTTISTSTPVMNVGGESSGTSSSSSESGVTDISTSTAGEPVASSTQGDTHSHDSLPVAPASVPSDSGVAEPAAADGASPQSEPSAPTETPDASPTPAIEQAPTPETPAESSSVTSFLKFLATPAYAAEVASSSADVPSSDATATSTDVKASTSIDMSPAPVLGRSYAEIVYSQDGVDWTKIGDLTDGNEGEAAFVLPVDLVTSWRDASNIKVAVRSVPSLDTRPMLYVDAVYLAADYADGALETHPTPDEAKGDIFGRSVVSEDLTAMIVSRIAGDEATASNTLEVTASSTAATSSIPTVDELWLRDDSSSTMPIWTFVAGGGSLAPGTPLSIKGGYIFWLGENSLNGFNFRAGSMSSRSLQEATSTILEYNDPSGGVSRVVVPEGLDRFDFDK